MAEKTTNLTPREQEIFDMLLKGFTPKEIGHNTKLAYNTILSYQKTMYRKLGVHNINEFMVKYRPLNPNTQPYKSQKPPLKIIIPAVIFACVIVFLVCLAPWKTLFGYKAHFDTWDTFYEETSTITIAETNEIINGKTEDCITISGYLAAGSNRYCGILGVYDKETLEVVKKMKSLSFKVLGGGNSYYVLLPTADTINGDHYLYVFRTVKDTEITVTVNVPTDLRRFGWSGEEAEFIKENSIYLQFQPITSGPFTLKIWDIRFYK